MSQLPRWNHNSQGHENINTNPNFMHWNNALLEGKIPQKYQRHLSIKLDPCKIGPILWPLINQGNKNKSISSKLSFLMTSVQTNFPNPHSCQPTQPAGNANFHPELSGRNSRHKDLDHVALPWERFRVKKKGTQPEGEVCFSGTRGG